MKSCWFFISVTSILMICTHEGRGNASKPLPWFYKSRIDGWHVLVADTIPARKPVEPVKEGNQEPASGRPVVPVQDAPKTTGPVTETIKTVKTVPKSRKQPKPVVVSVPNTLPVKVPKIKTPRVVIRKIKL